MASQGGSLVVCDGRQHDHLRQQCQLRQQRFRSKFERRGGIDVAVDLVSEVQAMRKDVQSLSATADLAAHTAAMEQGGFEKTRTVVCSIVVVQKAVNPTTLLSQLPTRRIHPCRRCQRNPVFHGVRVLPGI